MPSGVIMWLSQVRCVRRLRDRVSSMFYSHGLFCASHPFAIISMVITIFLISCYPLMNIPLPGNAPLQYTTPVKDYKVPPTLPPTTASSKPSSKPLHSGEDNKQPRWYVGAPSAYIQQIIIKGAVSPWQPNQLIQTDAFRGPLSKVFNIIDQVNQFSYKNGTSTVSITDLCLHVNEVLPSKKVKGLVPEYNCLVVSPANFWNRDRSRFSADGEILKTIFKKHGQPLEIVPSVKDLLFGLPHKDIGVTQFYIRNRQRVVSYAVTLILEKYDPIFLQLLKEKLLAEFPETGSHNLTEVSHLVHIHFKDFNYFVEYTPLLVTYIVLFLYIYFSVCKIEMVKSKWGLALSAVATVVASLLITVSMCSLVGFAPSINGSEIFPYLVVIIGLENVLVLTKSVVSTPVSLDVKLRVAQGLQKEGWYILKNLCVELLILAVGFFTFVPEVQEFALFAVVGLLSDFFLQMFFFVTVLSVDIRRMELSDLHKKSIQLAMQKNSAPPPYTAANSTAGRKHSAEANHSAPPPSTTATSNHVAPPVTSTGNHVSPPAQESRPKAPPKPLIINTDFPNAGVTGLPTPPPSPKSTASYVKVNYDMFFPENVWKTPRRVRFMNYWARTRVVQRGMMACLVIWIILIIYKTGLVEFFAQYSISGFYKDVPATTRAFLHDIPEESPSMQFDINRDVNDSPEHPAENEAVTSVPNSGAPVSLHPGDTILAHENTETWRQLSYKHWPTLLGFYNISLRGRYITILPSMHLSLIIHPDEAIALRHPTEMQAISHLGLGVKEGDKPRIQDIFSLPSEGVGAEKFHPDGPSKLTAEQMQLDISIVLKRMIRYPRTQTESVLTILFGIASAILFVYAISLCYRCMCSRNYAKWRSSWSKTRRPRVKQSPYYKQIRESMPLFLQGHPQEVECVVTDGPVIVSSCLRGQLRVWDSMTGECITAIHRNCETPPMSRISTSTGSINENPDQVPSGGCDGSPHPVTYRTSTGGRARHPSGHSRNRSVDFADLVPDLSTTIETDFIQLSQQPPASNHPATSNLTTPPATSFPPPHRHHRRNQSEDLHRHFHPRFSIGDDPTIADHPASLHSSNSSLNRSEPDISISDGSIGGSVGSPWGSFHSGFEFGNHINSPISSSPGANSLGHASLTGSGFNFSHFDPLYEEHKQLLSEKQVYLQKRMKRMASSQERTHRISDSFLSQEQYNGHEDESRNGLYNTRGVNVGGASGHIGGEPIPTIWCLACHENLIVVGCRDGSIEFWDGLTGQSKCTYRDCMIGVTDLCFTGSRIIVARLNGMLDFIEVGVTSMPPCGPTTPPSGVTHKRNQLHKSLSFSNCTSEMMRKWDGNLELTLMMTVCAHQQPINILKMAAGRVITASQDHTLKVYRSDDALCLYTLHGHKAAVTALHLDQVEPTSNMVTAGSGSEDGTVRLWDLLTGGCIHKLEGHDGTVTSLTCTRMYVVSTGADDRLCIWERCKGHLLHWIQMEPGYCNSVAMLTSNLMVTGGQGCIYLWDVSKGHALRAVQLGDEDHSIFVRQLHVISNASVVCDFGHQLRVIHFPAVLEKAD